MCFLQAVKARMNKISPFAMIEPLETLPRGLGIFMDVLLLSAIYCTEPTQSNQQYKYINLGSWQGEHRPE